MKIKKFLKSLMAAAVALVVVTNVGGAVVTAEAATLENGTVETGACTHGSYKDENVGANFYHYDHQAVVNYYVEDEYGNKVNLSDVTGKTYYKTCTVTFYESFVNVRCTKCNKLIGTYSYLSPKMHSVCAVG